MNDWRVGYEDGVCCIYVLYCRHCCLCGGPVRRRQQVHGNQISFEITWSNCEGQIHKWCKLWIL